MLQPNGICALSALSHLAWATDLTEAIATVPGPPPFPTYAQLLELSGGRWGDPEYVRQKLLAHGFVDVKVEVVATDGTVKDAEAFWKLVQGQVQHLPRTYWVRGHVPCMEAVKEAVVKHVDEKYGRGKAFTLR